MECKQRHHPSPGVEGQHLFPQLGLQSLCLRTTELPTPLCHTLVDHNLVGLDANCPWLPTFTPKAEQGKFCADSLATAGRGANEYIFVGCVERLEDLCLNLVECLDGR